MKKKIQRLTEEELKRYERALQLWEISLYKQEAELEAREDELLAAVGCGHDHNFKYGDVEVEATCREESPEEFAQRLRDSSKQVILCPPVNFPAEMEVEMLEKLALLEDPREN